MEKYYIDIRFRVLDSCLKQMEANTKEYLRKFDPNCPFWVLQRILQLEGTFGQYPNQIRYIVGLEEIRDVPSR